jgi:Domain of unknown function (DUF4189)
MKTQIKDRVRKCYSRIAGNFLLVCLAFVSVGTFSTPTWAQQGCEWFGTRPFCDGQCPSTHVYTGQRESCTTGSRRFCCPASYERVREGSVNCKWVGKPGSMLYVCDDPEFVPWAAVAIDGKGGWGASIKPPSVIGPTRTADDARADARRRCGANCKVVMAGKGRCVAVAQSKSGGYWVGYAHGTTKSFVQDGAMKSCNDLAPPGSCRLEHVNCL